MMKVRAVFCVLAFMLSSQLSFAEAVKAPALPQEMRQIGFELLKKGDAYELLVPSGITQSLPAHATDFRYERQGDQVTFQAGASGTQRTVIAFDLETLSTQTRTYDGKKLVNESRHEIPDEFARTWSIWRSGGEELDYVLAEYDSASKTLKIVERKTGKLIKNLKLALPEGIRITVIEGRYLVATQTTGKPFAIKDRFSGSGRGCQLVLDLGNHLYQNSKPDEATSWALFSPDFVQSSQMGSIQNVLDRFVKSAQ